jgi:hypothetical protein
MSLNKKLNMTRHEAFHGSIPDVSNFRTFGCKVYAHVPHTARKKLEPKYQIGIFLGPELEGPCYKVLTYNEKLKRDKYQVRIFRDIVTFESLPKVTGMQDESQLHWGGHIDLPEGEEVAPDPAELEPLTGVPELQTSLDPPGEGEERQLALPVSEGDERYLQLALVDGPVHNPAHQAPRDVVADPEVALQQANTPSEVGGDGRPQRQNVVSSQSPTQHVSNGDLPPPAVDTVVHDPVTPSSFSIVPNVICRLSTGRIHGYDRTYAFCFDGHSASEIPVICKVATVTLISYICWNVCAFLVCEVSVANSHLRITVQMPAATYYTEHCYTHQLHLLAHLCIPCLRSLNCVFSLADYRTDACCVIPYQVPVHFKVNHVHATCSP